MTFKSLREAARYAGVTSSAILFWTDQYDIGDMVDGRWHIDKDKLDAFLAARDKIAALKQSIRKTA